MARKNSKVYIDIEDEIRYLAPKPRGGGFHGDKRSKRKRTRKNANQDAIRQDLEDCDDLEDYEEYC